MAGLWTEVRLTFPALSAAEDGYEVFAVVDASAGSTAHEAAIIRMSQKGLGPFGDVRRRHGHRRDHMGAGGQGVNHVSAGFSRK